MRNSKIMYLKLGDKEAEIQNMYRIGNEKIDIWFDVAEAQIRDAHPMLGSFAIDNDTLLICCHETAVEVGVPQARPPVRPGKGLFYWGPQRSSKDNQRALQPQPW